MTVIFNDSEEAHRMLYQAHRQLTAGTEKIHAVAGLLYNASRYQENRSKTAPVIEKLERARGLADEAWKLAGEARVDLIRLTGCSGTCSSDEASPQPDRESEREIDFETLAVEALHAWNNIPNTGFFSWPKDFPEGSRDGWRRVVRAIAGSSSGRTANFDFANGGSNPPPASTDLAAAHSEAKPAGLLNCDSLSASSSHGCSERISDGLETVPQQALTSSNRPQAPSPSVQTLQGEE